MHGFATIVQRGAFPANFETSPIHVRGGGARRQEGGVRFAPKAVIQTIRQVLTWLPHAAQIPAMHRLTRQSWKGAVCGPCLAR